ncbi:MAG: ABC transporter permease [Caldisericia bacterium]|nr:ABC transporter permease [Caldisericia bacterium]
MKHEHLRKSGFLQNSVYLSLLILVIMAVLLEFGLKLFNIPIWILPTPSIIFKRFLTDSSMLLDNTITTLIEAGLGFLIAIVVGVAVAIILYTSKRLRSIFYPVLVGSQTIPIITIAPLFVLWFGYGLLPKIVVVVLMCFFPICLSFLSGLLETDPDMIELMKTMSASKVQTILHCSIPSALPSFFSGLKISAAYCITAAVIGEWLGAKAGLGELMRRSMHSYSVDLTFAAIIIVTSFSLILLWFIQWIEKRVIFWKED